MVAEPIYDGRTSSGLWVLHIILNYSCVHEYWEHDVSDVSTGLLLYYAEPLGVLARFSQPLQVTNPSLKLQLEQNLSAM